MAAVCVAVGACECVAVGVGLGLLLFPPPHAVSSEIPTSEIRTAKRRARPNGIIGLRKCRQRETIHRAPRATWT